MPSHRHNRGADPSRAARYRYLVDRGPEFLCVLYAQVWWQGIRVAQGVFFCVVIELSTERAIRLEGGSPIDYANPVVGLRIFWRDLNVLFEQGS